MRVPRRPTRGCADFEVVEQPSIGAEPVEIARATEALSHLAPRHPTLAKLEARIRQARRMRALLYRLSKLGP
jgi:hypothetical protein